MPDSSPGTTQIVAVAPPSRPSLKEWLPAISTLAVLAGMLLTGGGLIQNVKDSASKIEKVEKDTASRIEKVEKRVDLRDEQMRDVQVKMGGMDAKLDILIVRWQEHRQ